MLCDSEYTFCDESFNIGKFLDIQLKSKLNPQKSMHDDFDSLYSPPITSFNDLGMVLRS